MNDIDLLELAARAAGIEGQFTPGSGEALELSKPYGFQIYWNPLKNDGDALRLAVKIKWVPSRVEVVGLSMNEDPYAATRRAIVRVAAEIGKEM